MSPKHGRLLRIDHLPCKVSSLLVIRMHAGIHKHLLEQLDKAQLELAHPLLLHSQGRNLTKHGLIN